MAARSSVSATCRAAAAMASAPVALRLGAQHVQRRQVDRVVFDLARRCGSWSPPPRPDIAPPPIPPTASPRRRRRRSRWRRRRPRRGSAPGSRSSIPASAWRPRPACRRCRQARVMSFCTPGTFSSGISTPRSPRATISASARSRISSSRATACGFSILAITAARPRVIFFASATSSGRCTNDSATQSMPASSAASRSARSFAVSAANGMTVSGRLTPLRFETLPPTSTRATMRCGPVSVACRRSLPSSISSTSPGLIAAKISAMRQMYACRVAGRRIGVEHELLALVEVGCGILERTEPQLRSLQIDQDADRPIILGFDRANRCHELAHAVVAGMAHVDAKYVGAGGKKFPDHRPVA